MSGGIASGAGVAVPASDGDHEPLAASGGDEPSEGRLNAAEMAAFRRFQRFLRTEEVSGSPPMRRGRRRREDEEEEEGRGSSGPPPTWDGSTSFEDFHIKAKLWLATTKVKPRARGPLILKSLTGAPFEHYKYLAKDAAWLSDSRNAEMLLEDMNKPENYGEDRQEHLLTALSRVTYHLRRGKTETWREFFSRWDTALRKVAEHKVVLPDEYQGFLLINGLQLSDSETKAMLNYTHGCIKPHSVKEWLRKNETKLSAAELGADRKKPHGILHTEALDEHDDSEEQEVDDEIEELEAYLVDLKQKSDDDLDDVLEENEAAEILATVLQQKRSYKQALKLRKEKELSRGYGKKFGNTFN